MMMDCSEAMTRRLAAWKMSSSSQCGLTSRTLSACNDKMINSGLYVCMIKEAESGVVRVVEDWCFISSVIR